MTKSKASKGLCRIKGCHRKRIVNATMPAPRNIYALCSHHMEQLLIQAFG